MTPTPVQAENAKWFAEQFAEGFASVLEAMAGARPDVAWEMLGEVPPIPADEVLRWKQSFTTMQGETYLWGLTPHALAIGNLVMLAAGVEDSSDEELKSTFLESAGQAFSVVARNMTTRLGREITPFDGQEITAEPGDLRWASLRIVCGDTPAMLYLGVPAELLDALVADPKPAVQAAAAGAAGSSAVVPSAAPEPPAVRPQTDNSQTFELLLDVELPVSVSFGHAQVALKDVLKLTTGSIVELSRAVVEPVDVVVNNCVIARGEVVVVEGNFGVRIQHVVSRSDRLRSIQ